MRSTEVICKTPAETFRFGEELGATLRRGEIVLLYGGLGAGKTLLTKGILHSLGFDIDEVTSPSFTLVNLYRTSAMDVYHIDLWRLDESQDVVGAVGLDEIVENENALTIIEWADRLDNVVFSKRTIKINISGDGDEPREIGIKYPEVEATV